MSVVQQRLEQNELINDTKEELRTVQNGVICILETDFRARNDDKWLCYRYIRDIQGINLYIPFEDFAKMTSFETIRRTRQKIQHNMQSFLPTSKEVIKKRFGREIAFREYAKEQEI